MTTGAVLRARLGALRRLVRAAMLAIGVGRLLCITVALVLLSLALDRGLRLPQEARLILLCMLGAVLLWQTGRHLVRPLVRSLPDQALALELEQRRLSHRDLLASAVHFLNGGVGHAALSSLESATVQQAEATAASLNPAGLVQWRQVSRWLLLGCAAGALMLALGVLRPAVLSIWFERNVLLADRDWPRRTRLALLDFPDQVLYVPPGGDVTIRVQASGVVPRLARLKVRGQTSGQLQTHLMQRLDQAVFCADLNGIAETCTFTVRAGDGILDERRIQVVERPRIAAARMVVQPPLYIAPEPVELTWNAPAFGIPRGSRATVLLEATKPVAAAFWQAGDAERLPMERTGPRSVQCSFTVMEDARCDFTLSDELGIELAEPLQVDIRALEDRAPEVRLRASGVATMLVPGASLPLSVEVSDDYGADMAWLDRWYQGQEGRRDFPRAVLSQGPPRTDVTARSVVELSELGLPARGRFVLAGGARDACTVGGPNTGRSAPLTFRLVTLQELLQALLLHQQDLRRDLEDQMRREGDVRVQLEGLPTAGGPGTERLDELERMQRSVAAVLELTAAGYEAVLEQMLNNDVLRQASYDARVTGIVRPLRRLAGAEGPALQAAEAIKNGGSGGGAAAAGAVGFVNAALSGMQQVRGRMMLLEDYAALLASVEEVADTQQELFRLTDKLHRGILDDLLRSQ